MKAIYVKDLKRSDILTQEMFAIQNFDRAETKDGKPFIKMILSDKTGQINGQIWSDSIANIERGALQKGDVILLDARVEEFKGALQLNITKVNRVNEQFLTDFVEGSSFSIDELWSKLNSFIDRITDQEIEGFLKSLLADPEIRAKYEKYPAAEYVHHNFQSGLMEHVVEMLEISEPLRKYYPEANFDLVTAGIILHDIGKLQELERQGISIQRTTSGYLIGHLIQSYELLLEKGKGILSEKNLLNLKHIILSHHGELEYGSPIKPATIEAMIIHKIDMLSSQIRAFQRIIRSKTADELGFTEYDKILGTKVYLGNINPDEQTTAIL